MKKALAVVIAAAMTVGMTACGGNATTSTASSGANSASSGSSEKGNIVIGCLQDVTGTTSSMGISVQSGAQAAVDKINSDGGINGHKITMKTYDTKGDVTEAVNAYLNAVTVDKVKLIVGPPVANIANAIKETTEGYNVPVVGLAMDPTCQVKNGKVYKNMFCFQPNADDQGKIMAAFAAKKGFKTYGIIYNRENSYSVSLLQPFKDELSSSGIKVKDSCVVAYGKSDTDYKTLLSPIVSSGVEAIYCPNYTQDLVNIVTAARALGYKGAIIAGLDAAPSFNKTYGNDCTNIYYINNIDIFDSKTKGIIDRVSSTVSATNKYCLGYDIVMCAAEAFKKAGTDDNSALTTALENTVYTGLTGEIKMNSSTHMLKNCKMFMYTYDNQTPKMLEKFGL